MSDNQSKMSKIYLNWIDQDFHLFEDCEQITKLDTEPEKVEDTMKVTRERSSGPNIFDVSRTIVSMNVDGTVKKNSEKSDLCKYFDQRKEEDW